MVFLQHKENNRKTITYAIIIKKQWLYNHFYCVVSKKTIIDKIPKNQSTTSNQAKGLNETICF